MGAVEDRLAIERTLAEYCRACDDGRFADLGELFTEGAELVMGGETHTSRSHVRDAVASRQPPARRGLHMTGNLVVEIVGETASAECDFAFFAFGADGRLAPSVIGRYIDRLERADTGEWRFSRREITMRTPPQRADDERPSPEVAHR